MQVIRDPGIGDGQQGRWGGWGGVVVPSGGGGGGGGTGGRVPSGKNKKVSKKVSIM